MLQFLPKSGFFFSFPLYLTIFTALFHLFIIGTSCNPHFIENDIHTPYQKHKREDMTLEKVIYLSKKDSHIFHYKQFYYKICTTPLLSTTGRCKTPVKSTIGPRTKSSSSKYFKNMNYTMFIYSQVKCQ